MANSPQENKKTMPTRSYVKILNRNYAHFLKSHREKGEGSVEAFYIALTEYRDDPMAYRDVDKGLTDEQMFEAMDGQGLVETVNELVKAKRKREK